MSTVLEILFCIIFAFALLCIYCSIKVYINSMDTKDESKIERRIGACMTFMVGTGISIILLFIRIIAR